MTAAEDARSVAWRSWNALVERFLPEQDVDSPWRSAPGCRPIPQQGWKLHVSATLPDAAELLGRVAPLLDASGLAWKAARDLDVVEQLNSGIFFGYSQIGKLVTVYAGEHTYATEMANLLDAASEGLHGPRIPFDRQWRPGSLVHYRYGAFASRDLKLVTPDGRRVADRRLPGAAVAPWVDDLRSGDAAGSDVGAALPSRYLTYEALMQRGKGGTYLALDLASDPPRRCVMREGRLHGETAWDGLDGAARVRHEDAVLEELTQRRCSVPRVLDHFVARGNQYLVLEHFDGPSLAQWCLERDRSIKDLAIVAHDVAAVVASVHEAGWAWRDCKSTNLVVAEDRVHAVDFEGACRLDGVGGMPWGSPRHLPPEWPNSTPASQDCFALGVVMSWMLNTGGEQRSDVGDGELRRELASVADSLQAPNASERATAAQARDTLKLLGIG